ncbi:MAG: NADH-quinone oxidoreductase subunit F, partial [Candidatus Brocadia sp.]|nr:NADH-quinone oxidoreductase subunit F [Candidatus Brocadia sp.]
MDTIEQQKLKALRPKIIIGMASCGIGAGAKNVLKSIEHELAKQKLEADIVHTGCIGMCAHEVLVDVLFPGRTRVTYGNVKAS